MRSRHLSSNHAKSRRAEPLASAKCERLSWTSSISQSVSRRLPPEAVFCAFGPWHAGCAIFQNVDKVVLLLFFCEMDLDEGKIDDAVLALLSLSLHAENRAWKGFDWDAMGRLHSKGLISNPVGKAHSVVLTDEGLRKAEHLLLKLFGTTKSSISLP